MTFSGLLFLFLVDVPAKLEIDAPYAVRLLVQQGRLAAVEGRVEPEPALGREVGVHHHVGDQKVVLEDAADEIEAEHGAYS